MTGTIARITVFYFRQYFRVPTRVTSWVYNFVSFILACYVIILLNLRTFYILLIFNKCIYTLYIVVLVIYSLIWRTTMQHGWRFRIYTAYR